MEKIKSIEDLLKNYQNYEKSEELISAISFELHYKDPKLHAELTKPYIYTLEEFQKSVYYAYLAVKGRKENLIYLSEEEKNALRIKYKIEDGSDKIDTLLEFPEKFLEIFSKGFETMESKDKKIVLVVFISFVFGYLSIDKVGEKITELKETTSKTEIQEKNIEREEKLYKTFLDMKEKVGENPQFENKKQDALLKPVVEYKDNKLVTKETTITHDEAKKILNKKQELNEKETIIKEGEFYVDGIKGASNEDMVTYYLKNDKEEIKLDVSDTKQRAVLFQNIGKIVFAKIEIIKENKIIKERKLLDVKEKETTK